MDLDLRALSQRGGHVAFVTPVPVEVEPGAVEHERADPSIPVVAAAAARIKKKVPAAKRVPSTYPYSLRRPSIRRPRRAASVASDLNMSASSRPK
jgi:hypothetical protein